jgi:hypothetical protein
MATYNSTQYQKEVDSASKLAVNVTATPVNQERRKALFDFTFTVIPVDGDLIILGKLPARLHRVDLENVRLRYGGTSWANSVVLSLRRSPVTVGTDATTLGSITADGTGVETVTLAANTLQAQADENAIYYFHCDVTGNVPVGAIIYVEMPYDVEGI